MENLSLKEHLEHNEGIGVHGERDKGTDHLRREWIIRQRNGSSNRGNGAIRTRMEYLRAWMHHL